MATSISVELDLMMMELRRYGVSVAAIQETKINGSGKMCGRLRSTHSGRPLPDGNGPAVRNEGVGIALDKRATAAWKAGGEVWEPVSSRIVTARLKAVSARKRRRGKEVQGRRKTYRRTGFNCAV